MDTSTPALAAAPALAPALALYNYKATIVNIVDGDTIDATVQLGFYLTATLRLRLLGVNAPEMKGATLVAARQAKAFVARHLLGKDVVIHTEKADSFGRWLCLIHLDGENFNQMLIASGFAIPFMTAGKTLARPDDAA